MLCYHRLIAVFLCHLAGLSQYRIRVGAAGAEPYHFARVWSQYGISGHLLHPCLVLGKDVKPVGVNDYGYSRTPYLLNESNSRFV
mgnify:CR=1 FL=1